MALVAGSGTSRKNTGGNLFDVIRNQFDKDTGGSSGTSAPPLVDAIRNDIELPASSGGGGGGATQPSIQQDEVVNSVQLPDVSMAASSIPRLGSTAASVRTRPTSTLMSKGMPTVSYGSDGLMGASMPNLKKDEKKDEDVEAYESYFLENGMSQDDLNEIGSRGSWLDTLLGNPATAAVTDNFATNGVSWNNPFAEMDIGDLRGDLAANANSLAESGNFVHNEVPERYRSDNRSTIGDTSAIDNGRTMDYDHLTADKVTGEAMQKYGELGMGGRDWWEYSPSSIYTKSDEAKLGFRPYLPDETSRANMAMSEWLDAPGDVVGALAGSRNALADLIGQGYKINYDLDGDDSTTDDIIKIDGPDWEYRSKPYVDNMTRLFNFSPETFVNMPEGGKVHGAPVSTLIHEYEMKDADGTTKYLHGSVDNEKSGWVPDGSGDYTFRLAFTDGQTIDMPDIQEGQDIDIPDPNYVPIERARGVLPENLDSLNDGVRANGYGSIYEAPVLYIPDLVMDDGTRLTWDQVQNIYSDREVGDNPDTPLDDNVSYDVNFLNKPRRLMGEISNDFLENLPSNAWDFTAGSLPISIDKIAWPVSVTSAVSNSLAGVDPGSYDPFTGSSQYLSADYDDEGHISPTYNDMQQVMNFAGNSLVPLTEQIAGPVSGHSAIEWLSGKSKPGSNVRQVLRDFGLGMVGEGMEEVVGNFFDELTNQGLAAYGAPTNEDGERLLDENGEPVRDENGNYKYVDVYGNPMEYMTDETGHVYQDRNTPIDQRLRNMLNLEDAKNALLGGALVDATMQLVPIPGIPKEARLRNQLKEAARRDQIRDQLGLAPYKEVERGDAEFEPMVFDERM